MRFPVLYMYMEEERVQPARGLHLHRVPRKPGAILNMFNKIRRVLEEVPD